MRHIIQLSATAALIAGFSLSAIAENRTPAELAQTISPDYRSGDMHSAEGEQFVWVRRIEGEDEQGRTRVLFTDLQGALLPLNELHQAERLINPLQVEHKGRYQAVKLQLADRMLSISKAGMQHLPLPDGITTKMVLDGPLQIDEFKVSSPALTLQSPLEGSVALLTE